MAQCPVCQNELPDDFGLIDCGNCKTPLIVQLDGSVIAANTEPPPPAEDAGPPSAPEISPEFDFSAGEPHVEEPQQFEELGAPFEEPAPEPAAEPAPVQDVDAIFEKTEEPSMPIITSTPIEDLSALANSVDSAPASGVLRYTVEVSGIDTADIRNDFREMISDRRFLWDVEGIVKSIKSGTVKLEDVSAVKALLLVHRLRGLPVRVSWEQHVAHES